MMVEKLAKSGYGAVLHRKWDAGKSDNEIIGYWAEDNSTYTINVPSPLRNKIIEIQNWLHEVYIAALKVKKEYDDFNDNLSSFWSGLL